MMWMLVLVALWCCTSARLRPPLRVQAGQEDIHNEFPFVVSLRLDIGWSYWRICTGSLIALEWVLTAAHCFDDGTHPVVRYTNFTLKPGQAVEVARVRKIILHPGYRPHVFSHTDNDIALMKVSGIRNKSIGKLSAIDYKALLGLPVKYAGFGRTTNEFESTQEDDELQSLQVGEAMVMPPDKSWDARINIVPKCSKREQGAQPGDSGGPLIYDGKIIGVASKILKHPKKAFYAAVSVNLQWIRHQITGSKKK